MGHTAHNKIVYAPPQSGSVFHLPKSFHNLPESIDKKIKKAYY
jgi:hypothetical protein